MPAFDTQERRWMQEAIALARRGEGAVEPNPMVGCVVVREGRVVGRGWHRRFGDAHAEVEAVQAAAGQAAGATMVVTLEPCCHHGKTPPCTAAIIGAGITRVLVGHLDPYPQVNGAGIQQLRDAGLKVDVGLEQDDVAHLIAPYVKRQTVGHPWVIAKWAMTLDGKIATRQGDSRWISSDASRRRVHQLRGRVDAIVVGRRTVAEDDPLLTARPPGPRVPTRIVLDSHASLPSHTQLVETARQVPLLCVAGAPAERADLQRLEAAGCEVLVIPAETDIEQWPALLDQLAARDMTNVLIEGGGHVLGSAFDAGIVDEVHVYIAPKIVGGLSAPSPVAGRGLAAMADARMLRSVEIESIDGDLCVRGRLRSP